MKSINDSELNECLQSEDKKLVLFSAEWCGPCKIIKPTLEELENDLEDGLKILRADVSEAEENTKKFGIRNIPTCVLIKGGEEVGRFSGVKNLQQIKDFLQEHSN